MIVNCVVYQDGRRIAQIGPGEIRHYVSLPECLVWIALFEPSAEELDAMQAEFGLHELAVEDARHGRHRRLSLLPVPQGQVAVIVDVPRHAPLPTPADLDAGLTPEGLILSAHLRARGYPASYPLTGEAISEWTS
ncbi:MAG: hypothetical protein WCE38_00760 [Burkholderiales bacterium]